MARMEGDGRGVLRAMGGQMSSLSRRGLLRAGAGGAALAVLAPRLGGVPTTAGAAMPAAWQADPPRAGGSMVVGFGADPDTLDPHNTYLVSAWRVIDQVFDRLIGLNAKLEFEPILAERWETSADGRQLTFTLRPGLSFHDGTPLDAEAVKFSFDRLIDPAAATLNAANYSALKSVDILDDRSVRLNLGEPFAPILALLTTPPASILSPAAVKQYGDAFGRNPVGTGAFKFQEWVVGERITLVRNDAYQNFHSYDANKGAPYLDELVIRILPEEQTQVAALEAGEVHLVPLPAQQLTRFANNPDYQIFESEGGIEFLDFTMLEPDGGPITFKPPFDDIRLRQAVGAAINVDEIIQAIFAGKAVRNHGPLPTTVFGYDPAIAQYGFTYDPAKAGQLLDAAGWTAGAGGVREKNGQPLDILFYASSGNPEARYSQVIQNQLQQVGFGVTLETLDPSSMWDRIAEDTAHINPDGWAGTDPYLTLDAITNWNAGIGAYQKYRPEFAALLTEVRKTYDLNKQKELYFAASKMLLDDAAIVPLWTGVSLLGLRAEVEGFKVGPHGTWVYQDAAFAN